MSHSRKCKLKSHDWERIIYAQPYRSIRRTDYYKAFDAWFVASREFQDMRNTLCWIRSIARYALEDITLQSGFHYETAYH